MVESMMRYSSLGDTVLRYDQPASQFYRIQHLVVLMLSEYSSIAVMAL